MLVSIARIFQALSVALPVALLSAILGGCNIVGPAVVLIHGPEKQAAQFDPPAERPTVVFIDDRRNWLDRRALRNTIARTASDELLKAGAIKTVIDPKSALTRVSGEQESGPVDLATLGASVGAEVLIFATVDEFTLSRDGATFQPTARLRVKVIDCVNKPARLWPDDTKPDGYLLEVVLPYKQGTSPKNGNEYMQAQERLAKSTGEDLAKLFYKHVIQQRVSDLNDRKKQS